MADFKMSELDESDEAWRVSVGRKRQWDGYPRIGEIIIGHNGAEHVVSWTFYCNGEKGFNAGPWWWSADRVEAIEGTSPRKFRSF